MKNVNLLLQIVLRYKTLILSLTFTVVVSLVYQNCSKKEFNQNSISQIDKYSTLSVSDTQTVDSIEAQLKLARLDIFSFIDVFEAFESLTKVISNNPEVLNLLQVTSQPTSLTNQQHLENLYLTTSILSQVINVLNTIPALDSAQREALAKAIELFGILQNKKPDLMVLNSLSLLVELKNVFLDELSELNAPQLSSENKFEVLKSYTKRLSVILEKLSAAMLIARPSDTESMKSFSTAFMSLTSMLASASYGQINSQTIPNPVTPEVLNNIISELNHHMSTISPKNL